MNHVILSAVKLIGKPFYFQQDSDPTHTSKLGKNDLQRKSD